MLGTYYRMIPNLRAGLFYQRQYGFRHDADWIRDPVVEWKWANTNGRGEDLLIFDFSPKLLLSFLPGTNWSFEFKARYEYNFFNRNQSLRLAPTLTYFWIRNGEAFLNFFLQEDQVFPLNYGKKLVNEQWTYLGVLYNYDSQWQAGLYGSRKKQSWVSTDEYEQVEAPYRVTTSGSMIGLLLIYKFASE